MAPWCPVIWANWGAPAVTVGVMPMSSETYLPPRSGGATYGFFSIRSYLLLLIAAILVPMLVLAAVLAWQYAAAARRTIEAQRLDVANNLTNLVDREIGAMAGFLSGFSISPRFQAGEPIIVQRVTSVARERGFQMLAVYDRAGQLVFASPADDKALAASAERAGVAEVVGGRKIFVSDLQVSATAKPGLFFISVPVIIDGRVALVLSGGVEPQRLQGLFAEAGLRDEWSAGITDRTGVIVARSRQPEVYVGHPAQQPMIAAALGSQSSGLFDVVSRDGIEVKNSFQRSALTGWTAGVAVPASVVNAPLWTTAIILIAVGLCFTLLSLLLASLVASRITRAVHQIGQAVVAFATGDVVPLPTKTLAELRDVLRVIEGTAAMGGSRAFLKR